MEAQRSVVLAGVGGDAHFVGLTVLRAGLIRAGYRVLFLGTQNSVDDVCAWAADADAVLVSNMDGHAKYYLSSLTETQREHQVADRIWYLGGYPALDGDETTLAQLKSLGFDRVFHGYAALRSVLDTLAADLAGLPCRVRDGKATEALEPERHRGTPVPPRGGGSVRPGLFPEKREEVLFGWHTGWAAADLDANAERLRRTSSLAACQRDAHDEGRILIQPRIGVSDPQRQRELFSTMRDAGADVLSFQIDSLTRNNRYSEIEGILKGASTQPSPDSVLNGFPAVNIGMAQMASLASEFRSLPMQVRHSTRDPRLLAELTFGAGISAFEGGALSYNLPYYRDYPVRDSLESWRYVDQLAGRYWSDYGVVIDREFFGVMTACLVPPSLAVAVNVFEALLAAQAGVRSVTLGYAEQGNRRQDLAATRVMRALALDYLAAHGHRDVAVDVVWHQYMGPFPRSEAKARQILVGSAVSAARADVVRLMLKTSVEALHIPDGEENRDSLLLVDEICRRERAGPAPARTAADAVEERLIRAETQAIVDKALEAADGDVSRAVELAVSHGWLDIPFSPSLWNAGEVLPVRDCEGAVRIARLGDLPFPADVVEVHEEAVARRFARDGNRLEELIEADIAISAQARFDTWPLG
ncbi:hypothetical protein ACFY1U_39685 [Streptomyces sp. NPDC001351]|uniref:hypothetical protein n=1 Tax=Streptomyces sp. NPDC001351 TaxID=3364564 RepID=UPI0036859408